MRITNKMIASNLLSTLARNRSAAAELELDMATTKKVRRPSDDPWGAAQIERYKTLISKNDQYGRNIDHVRGSITASASALDGISEHLAEARQIALQGASGTLNADARQSLAGVVDQMIERTLEQANAKYNNRYLFAGTLTTTRPYSRNGDTVTYHGNENSFASKVGTDSEVTYNKHGNELFAPAGGTDIMQALIDLKQGLESDDAARIEAAVGTLDSAFRQVTNKTAELGALQSRLDLTEEMLATQNISLAERLSKIQDTDVVEALVQHDILENAITTGLRTMSSTIQTTLADFVS
jgi:flagellar hook-associated protein 3 FlgL